MAGIFLVPERIQNIFEKPQENYKTIELSKSHTSHKLLDGEFQKLFHSLYIDESPRNWSNMAAWGKVKDIITPSWETYTVTILRPSTQQKLSAAIIIEGPGFEYRYYETGELKYKWDINVTMVKKRIDEVWKAFQATSFSKI